LTPQGAIESNSVMRRGLGVAPLLLLACASVSRAQWVPGGSPVCTASGTQTAPVMLADHAGGAFIAWQDGRNDGGDIYMLRVTRAGARTVGWPAAGLAVCTASATQRGLAIVSDGADGAIVAWRDDRAGLNSSDLYAERVTAAGAIAPGWTAGGTPLCVAAGGQRTPALAPDGTGGVFALWADFRAGQTNADIYLQHLTATGAVAAGWQDDGRLITQGSIGGVIPDRLALMADGQGGVFAVWPDPNSSGNSLDLFVQRIDGAGNLLWSSPADISQAPGWQSWPVVTSDGAGGALIAWVDPRTNPTCSPTCTPDIYMQRITASGALAVGWPGPVADLALCTAAGSQDQPVIATDGASGALVAWRDARSGTHIYMERATAAGTLAPGWPAAGVALPVCTAAGSEQSVTMVADGAGGALLAWTDTRFDAGDIYAIRMTGAGASAAGWTIDGMAIAATSGTQSLPAMVGDGAGGGIVAWTDTRSDGGDIYAQRVLANGTVAPTTDVGDPRVAAFRLFPPSPNPARGAVTVRLELRRAAEVAVEVIDIAGRPVRRLAAGALRPGIHAWTWPAIDAAGARVPPGAYYVRATVAGSLARTAVIVLR
jgi:flagellar hook capping protein FlgD